MSTYPHIVMDAESGRPCIEGTSIKVTEIALLQIGGRSIADLLVTFPERPPDRPLTLGEVYSALAYYHDHREQLEGIALEDQRQADVAEKDRLCALMKKLLGQ